MGVDIHSKLRVALGTMKDQATISKAMIYHHENKGFSEIEIAVVRATAHDDSLIDDKNLHEILFLVSNSPGSIPFLAERISRRLGKTRDRLVAIKTLLLIHRLLRGGNRYFEQQLRSTHVSGHLQMCTHWFLKYSDPLACFLHKYTAYLEERIGWVINQAGKLEPVTSQGPKFRRFDEKAVDIVFRELPKCQFFIDKVLECCLPFDALSSHHLHVAQAAMSNTLKESFQVYNKYCEGVAALTNIFFDLTKPARALACQILKKASQQSKELEGLYENCKRIMGNKNLEYPSVQIITMEHVLALEQCCSYKEVPGSFSSFKLCSDAPSWDCPTKSTKWEALAVSGKGGDKQRTDNFSLSTNLFSCTLETKISKVWVLFEE